MIARKWLRLKIMIEHSENAFYYLTRSTFLGEQRIHKVMIANKSVPGRTKETASQEETETFFSHQIHKAQQTKQSVTFG